MKINYKTFITKKGSKQAENRYDFTGITVIFRTCETHTITPSIHLKYKLFKEKILLYDSTHNKNWLHNEIYYM